MEVHLRANNNIDTFLKSYPDVIRTNDRFDVFIPDLAAQQATISQIYLCGPPAMTSALSRTMLSMGIPSTKFRVL